MKICPTCGESLSNEAKFCPVDGTSLQGVAPTPGSPPAAAGSSPFARTLYGAVPPPPAMPAPPASRIDPDVAEVAEELRIRQAAPDDLEMSVTPSDAMAPVPVASPAPSPPPISIERLPFKSKRPRPGAPSSSLSFERPRSPVGLAVGAALGGAALVSLLVGGARLIRKHSAKRATTPVGLTAPVAPPAAPSPPPVVPPPPHATPPPGAPVEPVATTPVVSPSGPAAPAISPTSPATPAEPLKPSELPEQAPPGGGDPHQADIYVRAGREHLSRGSYDKARSAFEQARAYNPTNAAALAGLGEVAFEEGKYANAVEQLRAATRLNRNSRYLTLLGNSYFKLKQYKQAVEQYKRALQLEPTNKEASDGLAASQKKLRGG